MATAQPVTLRPYDPIRRVQILGDLWKASKSGKTLTVERETTSPRGTSTSTMVFAKR